MIYYAYIRLSDNSADKWKDILTKDSLILVQLIQK